jgi:flagellar biosynthesis protein FlhA
MPTPAPDNPFAKLFQQSDLFFTFALFGVIVVLVLPVPPMLLDLLLAISIAISLMVLMIIIYVKDPSEFSSFPTLLLAVTIYRLGLNVASTRLILLQGSAGHVIAAFGNFVVGGNYVVGIVVFAILVIINFMVITKGAGRIAEVAARFTLDAMPGKQMAIDAELNAGMIDETTASGRRIKIQKEADFYGAMDGASKFVRGDAIAGILITFVNIIGGICIGVFQKGMELSDAAHKFTLLSIGDGLVAQIPALIISLASGILVTRTAEAENLGAHITRQLLFYPRAIAIVGAMMLVFALLPGMPFLIFAGLGISCFLLSNHLEKERKIHPEKFMAASADASAGTKAGSGMKSGMKGGKGARSGSKSGATSPSTAGAGETSEVYQPEFEKAIQNDIFAVELGYGLLPLADKTRNGDLLDRITGVRKNFAREMGLVLPTISVRDNLELEPNEYRFLLRGKKVAGGMLNPGRSMAMNVTGGPATVKGIPAVEPVFGLEAVWIANEEKSNAEMNGYTVVDSASVMITHLTETLRDSAAQILEREDTQKLIDFVKGKNPTLVSELLPDLVNVGVIQRVLQNLLRERLPIKNLTLILETIADVAPFSKNPDELSEHARKRLGAYFVPAYESEGGLIKAITLDPRLEQHLVSRVKRTQFDVGLMMDPNLTRHLISELTPLVKQITASGMTPVIITSGELRLPFKRFFEPNLPRLTVLAYQELPNSVQVQSLAIIQAPGNLPNEQENVLTAASSAA